MKIPALVLLGASSLIAGDLSVVTPNGAGGIAVIESMSESENIKNPEPRIQQEKQISVLEYKNLKPGKYRVSYVSVRDPFGFLDTFMETHVSIHKNDRQTVYLFEPVMMDGPTFPDDVSEFLEGHRQNLLELEAVYDGGRKSFDVARGGAGFIRFLRLDCEYHLKVWDHSYQKFPSDRKVIFEKSFRAVVAKPLFPERDDPPKAENAGHADGKTTEAPQAPR